MFSINHESLDYPKHERWTLGRSSLETKKAYLKFGDGDGPNLCRVKKKEMLVPHLLKIYFGLGWPSSVLAIVSSQRLKPN